MLGRSAVLASCLLNKYEHSVDDLIYVDDSFGIEEEKHMVLYAPYGEESPRQQATLLEMWDEVGIPHR